MDSTQKFDLVSSLKVISIEPDLQKMFTNKFPSKKDGSFDAILQIAREGTLPENVATYIEGVFDNVILKRESYLEKFRACLSVEIPPMPHVNRDEITNFATKANENGEALVESPTPQTKRSTSPKVKLPKEYNKKIILADMKARGDDKPNELEKAILALNDMKNLRAKLNAKGKKQRFLNVQCLSEADCREIVAVVKILKNRLGKI